MTTTNILSINFYAETINDTTKAEFMQAVAHEATSMSIQLCNDNISRTEKRIDSLNKKIDEEGDDESYTLARQLDAEKAKLETLNGEKSTLEEELATTLKVYTKVVDAMSIKNKDGFGNKKDVVRTVLRVLASWNNSKLVKYAIIPAFESPALYEALETIHVNSVARENGELSMTNEVKEAYKKASNELESIIKNTFSLPFETEYTSKTRVKMDATDKKLLNDCYIKGFSNKFDTDDDGVVTFKKRQINTLVKAKKNRKTGEVSYDYSGLASTISNIVIKHYFAD